MVNVLDLIAMKMYTWRVNKRRKKQAKVKLTEKEKKRKEIHQNMKDLYDFVNWLNTKGLGNRAEKKNFWMQVKNGEPLMEKTLKNLIEQFAPKEKEKK